MELLLVLIISLLPLLMYVILYYIAYVIYVKINTKLKFEHDRINCEALVFNDSLLWGMYCYDYTKEVSIGCKTKSIEEWDYFFSFKSKERFYTRRYTIKWFLLKHRYKLMKEYLTENNLL